MRIGDKVVCIKTNDLNEKGIWYTIIDFDDNDIVVTTDDDPMKKLNSNRHYFIHTQIQEWSRFSEHFINLKELRKLKINKLFSI